MDNGVVFNGASADAALACAKNYSSHMNELGSIIKSLNAKKLPSGYKGADSLELSDVSKGVDSILDDSCNLYATISNIHELVWSAQAEDASLGAGLATLGMLGVKFVDGLLLQGSENLIDGVTSVASLILYGTGKLFGSDSLINASETVSDFAAVDLWRDAISGSGVYDFFEANGSISRDSVACNIVEGIGIGTSYAAVAALTGGGSLAANVAVAGLGGFGHGTQQAVKNGETGSSIYTEGAKEAAWEAGSELGFYGIGKAAKAGIAAIKGAGKEAAQEVVENATKESLQEANQKLLGDGIEKVSDDFYKNVVDAPGTAVDDIAEATEVITKEGNVIHLDADSGVKGATSGVDDAAKAAAKATENADTIVKNATSNVDDVAKTTAKVANNADEVLEATEVITKEGNIIHLDADSGVKGATSGVDDAAKAVTRVVDDVGTSATRELTESSIKETTQEALEAAGRETMQELTESSVKETAQEALEAAGRETIQELTESSVKETAQEALEAAGRETMQELTESSVKETTQEALEAVGRETTQEFTESSVKETTQEALQTTTSRTGQEFVDSSSTAAKQIPSGNTRVSADQALTPVSHSGYDSAIVPRVNAGDLAQEVAETAAGKTVKSVASSIVSPAGVANILSSGLVNAIIGGQQPTINQTPVTTTQPVTPVTDTTPDTTPDTNPDTPTTPDGNGGGGGGGGTTETKTEDKTHTLTISYVYGYNPNDIVYTETKTVTEDAAYNYSPRLVTYYNANPSIITGVMPDHDVEVTVTYVPINDENGNGIADEEENLNSNSESSEKTTNNYYYGNSNNSSTTTEEVEEVAVDEDPTEILDLDLDEVIPEIHPGAEAGFSEVETKKKSNILPIIGGVAAAGAAAIVGKQAYDKYKEEKEDNELVDTDYTSAYDNNYGSDYYNEESIEKENDERDSLTSVEKIEDFVSQDDYYNSYDNGLKEE